MCACARTCDQGEAFHSTEVGVLDGHDSSLSEQLLGVVVDQLPVEEEEALKKQGRPLLDTWLYACVCTRVFVCVCVYLLMKQLIPCLMIRSTFSFIFSFSASSISATFAVESTRTLEPKIWNQTGSRF